MSDKQKSSTLIELESQINAQIERYNTRRYKLKRLRNFLVISQSVFAALTTLLIAINIKFNFTYLSVVAIISSTLSGLATVFLSQFMFHERLISHINTVTGLRQLQSAIKIQYLLYQDKNRELSGEEVESYFIEFQSILSKSNSEWNKLIKKNKQNKLNQEKVPGVDFKSVDIE
jgi:hypothetical protein